MNAEFASVRKAVGWSSFAEISELGSRELTIQFLCTLVETNDGISFQFFRGGIFFVMERVEYYFWVFTIGVILNLSKQPRVITGTVFGTPSLG